MRKHLSSLIMAFSLFGGIASAAEIDPLSLRQSHVCTFVKQDSLVNFERKIADMNRTLRRVFSNTYCSRDGVFEGGDMLHAAVAYGAVDVAMYLVEELPEYQLTKVDSKGLTVTQWIEEQYPDYSPAVAIGQAINKRLK